MRRLLGMMFTTLLLINHTSAVQPEKAESLAQTISEKTTGMQEYPGFFTYYWDNKNGKLWLEIDQFEVEFLYVHSLTAGVGSNDIGLDRTQLGGTHLVTLERIGPKVLLTEKNYSFRALTDNQAERRAVEDAFARSTLWGFEVKAEEKGRVLVDATDFFLSDAHNVVGRLKSREQGSYKLEQSRSAFYLPRTKNFPQNSEFEVTLTFTGKPEGQYVWQVVPSPEAITVRQHHSFIRLPDDSYRPRVFDPRAGFFGSSYIDYAAPLDERIDRKFIARHRLMKKDPWQSYGAAAEPIIYYIDPAIPEPIRSAVFDGARWWNEAFEAAGYEDAFQVKLLPTDADPMDLRYNMVNWVHRATRGWSYGSSVTDPRTGEILKGHVILGSLRLRQDYLLAEGLTAPYEDGQEVPQHMREFALARLRQLVAHEIGHTLGLAHNYIASTRDRASVMDYPHPMMKIKGDGTLDSSEAYDTGIGQWDKVAITYGYRDLPAGTDEEGALEQILRDGWEQGMVFITDKDARPLGGAHPQAHLWDNGVDAVNQLDHLMEVRATALQSFGELNIREGAPLATLEEVLVPVYLHHRYQLEAASKVLGGLNFTYSARGDGQLITEIVSPEEQRRALASLLSTVEPVGLALPEKILQLLPPRAYGYPRDRETFSVYTGVTFDPLAAAETATHLTVRTILHHERAARLVEYHARDSKYPGLTEVIDAVLDATWKAERQDGYHAAVQQTVENVVLYHLMSLAANAEASQLPRAMAHLKLAELKDWLERTVRHVRHEILEAHYRFAIDRIERFQEDPSVITVAQPADPPAGSPIGLGDDWCGRGATGWLQ